MVTKYEWSMKELVENIHSTLDMDKDFVATADGETGIGKTTFAITLLKSFTEGKIDMRKQVVFTRKDLYDAINTLPPKSGIVVDEAIMLFFNRDFMNKGQKELLKVLDVCRYRNLFIILCVPNLFALDKHLQGRIRLRAHIERRGLAFLFIPDRNPFVEDCWNRKINEKMCWNWNRTPNAKYIKGFVGVLDFGDLPSYLKDEYLPLQQEKKLQREYEDKVGDKEERMLGKYKKRFFRMIEFMQSKDITMRMICDYLGEPFNTIKAEMVNWRAEQKEIEAIPKPESVLKDEKKNKTKEIEDSSPIH